MIKGITVLLDQKEQTGTDDFNQPIYTITQVSVDNVLVTPVLSSDVIAEQNLSGKKAVYQLGIPKGDSHDWKDTCVEFFDKRWRTIGIPVGGIEDMIPLSWNKKISVEEYE